MRCGRSVSPAAETVYQFDSPARQVLPSILDYISFDDSADSGGSCWEVTYFDVVEGVGGVPIIRSTTVDCEGKMTLHFYGVS